MNTSRAINQYAHVNHQSLINEASPHQLIAMLINGALERLTFAKGCIERNEIANKAIMLGKAMDIIGGLQNSLDMENGGEISTNLDDLYNYMNRRLLVANSKNDISAVDEVIDLMNNIKAGWDGIPQEFHHLSASGEPTENSKDSSVAGAL